MARHLCVASRVYFFCEAQSTNKLQSQFWCECFSYTKKILSQARTTGRWTCFAVFIHTNIRMFYIDYDGDIHTRTAHTHQNQLELEFLGEINAHNIFMLRQTQYTYFSILINYFRFVVVSSWIFIFHFLSDLLKQFSSMWNELKWNRIDYYVVILAKSGDNDDDDHIIYSLVKFLIENPRMWLKISKMRNTLSLNLDLLNSAWTS